MLWYDRGGRLRGGHPTLGVERPDRTHPSGCGPRRSYPVLTRHHLVRRTPPDPWGHGILVWPSSQRVMCGAPIDPALIQGEQVPGRDDVAYRLEVAVESNEKHRSRARTVATLSAAAAGALAAGLTLAPTEALPTLARVLGLIAIVLLVVATAFSLAASSASAYSVGQNKFFNFLHASEAWRIRTQSDSVGGGHPSHEDLLRDAASIKRGIIRTLSCGLWSASIASIALVASLIVATLFRDASTLMRIELNAPQTFVNCPKLGQVFTGEVRKRDQTSSAALLPVNIPAAECGMPSGVTLFLNKSSIAILG